jgi:hypothetical protein
MPWAVIVIGQWSFTFVSVSLETLDFISHIIMAQPEDVLLSHERVNLTHRLLVSASLWKGYHILFASD